MFFEERIETTITKNYFAYMVVSVRRFAALDYRYLQIMNHSLRHLTGRQASTQIRRGLVIRNTFTHGSS